MKILQYSLLLTVIITALLAFAGCNSNEAGEPGKAARIEQGAAEANPEPERFVLYDPDGNRHAWSDYAGKPTVINFWATWCGPCRVEIPVLKKLYAEYKPKGLEIIGMSVDQNQAAVPPYVDRMGVPWVIVYATEEAAREFKLGQSIPTTIFIDADGNETGRLVGAQPERVFRQELEKLFP